MIGLASKLVFILSLSVVAHAASADLSGVVTRVLDGDTIDVLDRTSNETTRVRLIGIDAPEKQQPFGQRSRQHLSMLCAQQYVEVKATTNDSYGRVLGTVIVTKGSDSINVNQAQVASGFAWAYRLHGRVQDVEMLKLETLARSELTGLWSEKIAVEPWKWRKSHN